MNARNQLLCAHSALLFMICTGLGVFIMPGWLPPPSPGLDAAGVSQIFVPTNLAMRIGVAMVALTCPLSMGLPAAITTQLRRIEGEHHVLADLQLACAVVGVIGIEIPSFLWLAISYREGISPVVQMTLNDMAWFIIIGAAGSAVLENICIGLCILGDDTGRNIYPRWLGYWNLWLAITLLPGVLLPFFKSGPFAWNGIMGFWVVVIGFFIWLLLNYVYTVKAIKRQVREAAVV